jgi:hypothetical protein
MKSNRLLGFRTLGGWMVVAGTLFVSGCSSNVEVGSCASFCDHLCARMKQCDVGDTSATCSQDCQQQNTGGSQCSSNLSSIDQMSCDQMQHVVDCARYCEAVCARAVSCDSAVDQAACGMGCAQKLGVCNMASIDARDCTHIQQETRCYVIAGSARNDNTSPSTDTACMSSGHDEGSLCDSSSDCDPGLACIASTSLCGPCKTNDDCKSGSGKYYCSAEARCEYAVCLTDDECKTSALGPLCRSGNCVKCASNDDCPGQTCDKYAGCVQCAEDKDCASTSKCEYHRCWKRCTDDAECENGTCFLSHCTAPVGTACGDTKADLDLCGGALCINVSAQNTTIGYYCTRACYSTGPLCPTGYLCQDNECRKQ